MRTKAANSRSRATRTTRHSVVPTGRPGPLHRRQRRITAPITKGHQAQQPAAPHAAMTAAVVRVTIERSKSQSNRPRPFGEHRIGQREQEGKDDHQRDGNEEPRRRASTAWQHEPDRAPRLARRRLAVAAPTMPHPAITPTSWTMRSNGRRTTANPPKLAQARPAKPNDPSTSSPTSVESPRIATNAERSSPRPVQSTGQQDPDRGPPGRAPTTRRRAGPPIVIGKLTPSRASTNRSWPAGQTQRPPPGSRPAARGHGPPLAEPLRSFPSGAQCWTSITIRLDRPKRRPERSRLRSARHTTSSQPRNHLAR